MELRSKPKAGNQKWLPESVQKINMFSMFQQASKFRRKTSNTTPRAAGSVEVPSLHLGVTGLFTTIFTGEPLLALGTGVSGDKDVDSAPCKAKNNVHKIHHGQVAVVQIIRRPTLCRLSQCCWNSVWEAAHSKLAERLHQGFHRRVRRVGHMPKYWIHQDLTCKL